MAAPVAFLLAILSSLNIAPGTCPAYGQLGFVEYIEFP
ncbi:Uncharacterised protein [Serratia fonticola]|nr:Uncharacterised protein [Serratia fonticola]